MKYAIDSVAFPMPAHWRDKSDYTFAPKDETWMVSVRLASDGEAPDAGALLAKGKEGYLSGWGPAIIYSNDITLARGGASLPAVEGGQHDLTGPSTLRFGLAPLLFGNHEALLICWGPSSSEFMPFFRRLVASMSFMGESSLPPVPSGMVRRQANFVQLVIPADWKAPPSLGFSDPDYDSVAIRVTLSEPAVPEGTLKVEREVGRANIERSHTEPVRDLGVQGWIGEWVAKQQSEPRNTFVIRKASFRYLLASPLAVTLYGSAPADLVSRLDRAWQPLLAALRSAPNSP